MPTTLGNFSGASQELCSLTSPFSWPLGVLLTGPDCCSALPPTGKIYLLIPVLGGLPYPMAACYEDFGDACFECFGNWQFNLLHLHLTLSGCVWWVITACPCDPSCAEGLHCCGCCDSAIHLKLDHLVDTSHTNLIFPFFILRQAYSRGKCHYAGSFFVESLFWLWKHSLSDHVSNPRSVQNVLVCCGCYSEKSDQLWVSS